MSFLQTYKTEGGYVSEMSRTPPGEPGWTAFDSPVEWTGPCLAVTDALVVDFAEHRARYIAPDPWGGASNPDPGTPPDPDVVLATVASCDAWADTAEGTDAWEGYRHALWVEEQLSRTTPRAGVRDALEV
jgi:hypothetical protein